jgi:aquaporin Z
MQTATSAPIAARRHWPEYLIEGGALGVFMLAAGVATTALDAPASPWHALLPDATLRRVLIGVAMGLTAIALIQSPWGRRSGAHMNPAVTLSFLRLGRIAPRDALFYIGAQFIGAALCTLLVRALLGAAFASPPVNHVATLPGEGGTGIAFAAEVVIAFVMMTLVLRMSAAPHLARFTGYAAGLLVALFISVEAPLSGMSLNPARSFASALSAANFHAFWIYLVAPVLGMLGAAELHRRLGARVACAKLIHDGTQRCIHCGFEPAGERS